MPTPPERDEWGRFRPGHKQSRGPRQAPPPSTRLKTAREMANELRATISTDKRKALLLSIYERAIAGDNAAAELILSRMIAPLKPSREAAALPGNPDPTNPASIAQAAMAGLAAGQLSSDAAGELLKALESLVTIAATLQLQPQLEAMQAQLSQLIEARGGPKRLRGV